MRESPVENATQEQVQELEVLRLPGKALFPHITVCVRAELKEMKLCERFCEVV